MFMMINIIKHLKIYEKRACPGYCNDMEYVDFVWFDSLRPINNISVIKGRVFLGWTST